MCSFLDTIIADELVKHCSKLKISNDEEVAIDLAAGFEDSVDDKISLRLVGRILTEKALNFDAVKRTLLHIWSLKNGVVICAIGANLFLFQFFHWKDREKILLGRPWCFENKLIVLQEMDKDYIPADMVLNFSPFWIRLYDVPFGYRSEERVCAIAKSVGPVLEVEDDFFALNQFCRVRVMVDVTKPLRRFQMIKLRGESLVKVIIKYERLPFFCFLCGLMSHTEKDCTSVSDEDREAGYGWDMDLRASPR